MRHTFVALVEDKPGVLNRVTTLFRRRAFNIESLTVGHTERPGVSRVPPLLGEHTAEVLAELGYDQAAIKELASRHVIQL